MDVHFSKGDHFEFEAVIPVLAQDTILYLN